ncbi:MAG: pentapeptide repeat-containing protein [Acidobacteria bacterium]|nr:pentapeptide repeat-containing protein [Acidobacteriota bacterium]
MFKTNIEKIIKHILLTGVLITAAFLTGAADAQAQSDCVKNNDRAPGSEEKLKTKENIECWVQKAKNGEKDLQYADLGKAALNDVDLSGADLTLADLVGADLTGADLSNSNLSRAKFYQANLTNADLRGADLTKADPRSVKLAGATVSRATTKGIDFRIWSARGGTVVD